MDDYGFTVHQKKELSPTLLKLGLTRVGDRNWWSNFLVRDAWTMANKLQNHQTWSWSSKMGLESRSDGWLMLNRAVMMVFHGDCCNPIFWERRPRSSRRSRIKILAHLNMDWLAGGATNRKPWFVPSSWLGLAAGFAAGFPIIRFWWMNLPWKDVIGGAVALLIFPKIWRSIRAPFL